MATKIQWTEDTWNPIAGCSVVSPGCANCYAMRRAAPRLSKNPATPHYAGTVKPSKAGNVWTGNVGIAGDRAFLKPLRTKKPTMFFVNSMSDLFHENVPDEVIDRIFAIMALCPQHTFQVLTKRSMRMREYLSDEATRLRVLQDGVDRELAAAGIRWNGDWNDRHSQAIAAATRWPLPKVWLGVSVEDQTRADERIPDLLATPAAIRFISAEPLLGPVDLDDLTINDQTPGEQHMSALYCEEPIEEVDSEPWKNTVLDWVIIGGESGKGARPMHPDWARAIRDQCAAAAVPFFFKQWGNWLPWEPEHGPCWKAQNGRSEDHHALFPDDIDRDPKWDDGLWAVSDGTEHFAFQNVGTKAAGRRLDGVEHNAMPERT
jgi:protein gp37